MACPHCGAPIALTLDASQAVRQEYVEDCPVCCRPNVITVALAGGEPAAVDIRPEND